MLWEGASDFADVCFLTDCPCSSAWLHTHGHVGSADGHTGLGGDGGGRLAGDDGVEKMCWEGVQGKFKWEGGGYVQNTWYTYTNPQRVKISFEIKEV